MFADKILQRSDLTLWAEYKDGFILCLRHVTREELRKKVKRATLTGWDPKTHQQTEKIDDERYATELASLIVDWKGLTQDVLRSLVVLDEYPTENPYNVKDAEGLCRHAYDFDAWVQSTVTNIDMFRAYQDAEVKKKSLPFSNGASEVAKDSPANNV
jgi:hypothetical protein